jgi:diguanylate cyclase (GGDEF)-like protein
VLFCDLDGFKAVNDQYGHDRGDRLLVEVAERIGRAVRPSDTVCRTGGDEFVIVCEDLADADQAHTIADRVQASIEGEPVDVGETRLPVTVSVGVALADLPSDDPDRLLHSADLAMYAHKQHRSAVRRHPASQEELARREREREPGDVERAAQARAAGEEAEPDRRTDPFGLDLAAAIESDGLRLVHQPLVGRDGALSGIEALVRWDHPALGAVGPMRILSAAANDDLAGPLGRWIRRSALADRRRWLGHLDTAARVPVHLNVSDAELAVPHLADAVLADLEEAGFERDAVVLEVRERHLADAALRGAVGALVDAELEVLVENAGQGGLSLPDLASLPVRGLKLGPALVGRIDEDDPLGVEVARSLVILAHGLGWRSLAVGVETDHQRSVLFGFGVDAVQGAVATMPLERTDLLAWLDRHATS